MPNDAIHKINNVYWKSSQGIYKTDGEYKPVSPVKILNDIYKGNNKITELRTILQRNVKTHNYINRQNQSTTGKL
jgi:hypothetical protein